MLCVRYKLDSLGMHEKLIEYFSFFISLAKASSTLIPNEKIIIFGLIIT